MKPRRRITGRRGQAFASLGVVLALASVSLAAGLPDFGRCLTREGAIFYGTSWCPYCKAQRQLLGAAMTHVRYVDCSVDGGGNETAPECANLGIRSYPTWTFGDGSRAGGALPLSALAARTGCPLPEQNGRPTAPAQRPAGSANPGPKIIEVPRP